jgi:hypothetical protein
VCDTGSPTLREECRLRVFDSRVLRRIFESKRDEVRGEWRKLHNEELNDLYTKYYSGDQIKKNDMDGACNTCQGEERCVQGFGGET